MPITAKKTGPGLAKLKQQIEQIKQSDVLVGIPAPKTLRRNDVINNASLLFILTRGSALRNIPPTPILEPGVARARKIFTPHLALAAKAVLESDPNTAFRELNLAGTIAVNSVKRMFTDNDWPPNAPSTIARKGSDKRNIDTSQLRRAFTHIVRFKGQEQERGSEPEKKIGREPSKPATPEAPSMPAESIAPSGIAEAAEDAGEAII